MSWFLFEHPKYEYFHYRISQRWLAEDPPSEVIVSERKNTQFVLSFSALQKLAKILQPPSSLSMKLDSTSLQMNQPSKPLKEIETEQDNDLSVFPREQGGE